MSGVGPGNLTDAQQPANAQHTGGAQHTANAQHTGGAQQPAGTWRTTPKLNVVPTASSQSASPHDAKRPGWNLAWTNPAGARQTSSRPAVLNANTANANTANANTANTANAQIRRVSGVSTLHRDANLVRSAEFLDAPSAAAGVAVPRADANTNAPRRVTNNNFFDNPFGDDNVAHRPESPRGTGPRVTGPRVTTRQVSAQLDALFEPDAPAPAADNPVADPTRPSASGLRNQLRPIPQNGNATPSPFRDPEPGLTLPDVEELPAKMPAPRSNLPADRPKPPSSPSDNIRDMLEADEDLQNRLDNLPEPNDDEKKSLEENPFERNSDLERLRRDLNESRDRARQSDQDSRDADADAGEDEPEDDEEETSGAVSCDAFRAKVSADSIRNISLDPSPPLRPDVISQEDFDEVKAEFLEKQSLRQWRSIDGSPLATGYLRDLAYEKVVIETEYGGFEELPKENLSEADLAYVTESWGLPQECLIEQVAYQPRRWRPMTMTWKASNLCHKPLYFEEVNLERYGHTAGPVLQPIVSSAHFFANIAVLPYKMGVHSPQECQYALGYYRPGNCAPWIIPPMPISARGAAFQTVAMVGGAWLIP